MKPFHRAKTLAALFLSLALLCPAALAAPASGGREVEVTLNGFSLSLDSPARGQGGTTVVPVEELCAAIGSTGRIIGSLDNGQPIQGGLSYWWAEDGSHTLFVSWNGGQAVAVTAGEGGAWMEDGVLWAPLRPLAQALGFSISWDGRANLSVPASTVTVSTLEELLNAVGDNTTILLDVEEGTELDFSTLDWSQVDNPCVVMESDVDSRDMGYGDSPHPEAFDVIILDVQDLTISAPNTATLSTPWAYADVLKFQNCRRLTLEGLTAVHNVEPGFCVGDCLDLNDCRDVRVVGCTLDGSGAYGLMALSCTGITLERCEISHCTYGAVRLTDCQNVCLRDGVIQDCQANFTLVDGTRCRNVTVENTLISGCTAGALSSFTQSRRILFTGCEIEDCGFGVINEVDWDASGGAVFLDCTGLEDCLL